MADARRRQKRAKDPLQLGSTIAQRIVEFMQATSLSQRGSVVRCKTSPSFNSVVDVGCGDGRSTLQFVSYFMNVVGIDKSKTQISIAQENLDKQPPVSRASISFQHASGEAMPFPDSSQDLVCFSRSFHWMNLMSDALREARRVLKPTGCLAMYCTGFPSIERQITEEEDDRNDPSTKLQMDKKANEMLDNFFRNGCEMHPRCRLAVDDRYRRIYDAISVDHKSQRGSKFIVIDDKELALQKRFVTLSEFAEMLRSYAGYKCAMLALKRLNSDQNPLEDLLKDLRYLWSVEDLSDDEIFLNVTWEVSLILSTRPTRIKR